MNCKEAENLVPAYADRELDLVPSLELEKHLDSCPACSQIYKETISLNANIKELADIYQAPASLTARLKSQLGSQAKESGAVPIPVMTIESQSRVSYPWALAASFAAMMLLAFLLGRNNSSQELMTNEVVSAHARSLMANHLTDVASTDQHTVKPWFSDKVISRLP